MGRVRYATILVLAPISVLALLTASPVLARDADHHTYRLPAQSLADALRTVAVISGRAIVAPAALVAGKTSTAIDGDYATPEAVRVLLAGSGLRVREVAGGFVIEQGASPAPLAQIVASAVSFGNAAGVAYDPSKVVVFIDDSNVNAGRQNISGVDALFSYRRPLGTDASIGVTFDVAYLESDQQIATGLPVTQLAGIIFNPPQVRARGSTNWTSGGLSLTASGNYIGGVDDTRKPTVLRVGSMTTFDLAARYRIGETKGVLAGTEFVLAVQNLSNVKPSPIATTLLYDQPYDSTNQSPVGRFVSVSVTHKW
ncbi:MAG: TonB-dependent receptor [Sphingomonas sp.]